METSDDKNLWMSFWEDQRNAAEEQAKNVIDKIADSMGMPETVKRTENFYDTYLGSRFNWLRSAEDFKDDPPSACMHISLTSPSVIYVPLAEPRVLMCLDCALASARKAVEIHPYTCDHCKTEDVIFFHEIMIQVGMTIVSGNICERCYQLNNESLR